jgi:hypothetical protein
MVTATLGTRRLPGGVGSVTIYRLLQDQDTAFGPEEIEAMTMAYEDACRALKLTEKRSDPLTQILALKIIEIAKTGELDPIKIRDVALRGMHLPRD